MFAQVLFVWLLSRARQEHKDNPTNWRISFADVPFLLAHSHIYMHQTENAADTARQKSTHRIVYCLCESSLSLSHSLFYCEWAFPPTPHCIFTWPQSAQYIDGIGGVQVRVTATTNALAQICDTCEMNALRSGKRRISEPQLRPLPAPPSVYVCAKAQTAGILALNKLGADWGLPSEGPTLSPCRPNLWGGLPNDASSWLYNCSQVITLAFCEGTVQFQKLIFYLLTFRNIF